MPEFRKQPLGSDHRDEDPHVDPGKCVLGKLFNHHASVS